MPYLDQVRPKGDACTVHDDCKTCPFSDCLIDYVLNPTLIAEIERLTGKSIRGKPYSHVVG